jgi:regulator of sigma D
MPLNLNTIKAELAAVALALETRFELEDELLDRSRDRQAIAV